jgi:NADH-quinone oxidoreductase subunit N
MTGADWTLLWPFITIGATAIVAMVAIALRRSHGLTLGITLVGLGLAIWELIPAAGVAPRAITPLLQIDGFALFFTGLTAGAAFVVALLARSYLDRLSERREEFYVLLLIATLGAAVLAASNHFASFFLGLEILSVSLYGLNAYLQRKALPLEAGI